MFEEFACLISDFVDGPLEKLIMGGIFKLYAFFRLNFPCTFFVCFVFTIRYYVCVFFS